MKKIINVVCVFFLLVLSFFCSACSKNNQDENVKQELSDEQKSFNLILEKVSELEILSSAYNLENSTMRALVYIRSVRYNSGQWQTIGGQSDAEFDDYVLQNQTKSVSELKNLSSFVLPKTKEESDFVHMFATLNVLYAQENSAMHDLAGWGGDLCQLAVDAKNSGKLGQELNDYVKSIFNSKTGAFNDQDLCADLDAVNLAVLLKQSGSITTSLREYSNSLNVQERKKGFIQNVFNTEYSSHEQLKQDMFSRVKSNLFLNLWGQQNGLSFNDDLSVIEVCCDVFATYLMS